jgi:glutathione S-transferase
MLAPCLPKPKRAQRCRTRAQRPCRARPFATLPDAAEADSFTASPTLAKTIEDIVMIDLYALTSPNVQKVYIMLEETKLPYKEHFVDVWKGDQYSPDFIKVNPNSKIPAIVDHEGPGGKPITIFESGAILMYLAEKSGNFLPKDMAKKYDVLQWLMVQLTGVGPNFGQFTHFKMFAPKDKDHSYSMSRHHTEVKRLTRCSRSGSARRRISAATNIRSPIWQPSRGRVITTCRA